MKSHKALFLLAVFAAVAFSSCSGLPKTGGTGGGGGGGGGGTGGMTNLILTMHDAPPAGVDILSAPVQVGDLILDPVTGGAVHVTPTGQIAATLDLVRMQSDSTFVGKFSVPSQAYKDLVVTFATPALFYLNQSGSTLPNGLGTCPNNTICANDGSGSGLFATLILTTGGALPQTFSTATVGVSFDLNQSLMLTSTSSGLTLNFAQANGITTSRLPRTGTPSGSLELVEDFIGTVTNVSGNTVTVQPLGTTANVFNPPFALVATANSSTVFDNCATATIACVHVNQTLSVDASVNPDGSVTLLEVDDLNDTSVNEVEGVISSIDAAHQVFVVSIADLLEGNPSDTIFKNQVVNNSLGIIQVGLGTSPVFSVDTKGLPVPAAALATFTGFSNLAVGQTVRVNVSSTGTSTSGSPFLQATASKITLRFTRITGNVSTVGTSIFSYDSTTLPPMFGLTGTPQVQLFTGTRFDGVTDLTGITAGNSASVRALFLPTAAPPFFAAKVRKH